MIVTQAIPVHTNSPEGFRTTREQFSFSDVPNAPEAVRAALELMQISKNQMQHPKTRAQVKMARDRFFVAHRNAATQISRVLSVDEKVLWSGNLSLRGGLPHGTILVIGLSVFALFFGVFIIALLMLGIGRSDDGPLPFAVGGLGGILVGSLFLRHIVRSYRGTNFSITDQRLIEVRPSAIHTYSFSQITSARLKLRGRRDGTLSVTFGKVENSDGEACDDGLEWPTRDASRAFQIISKLKNTAREQVGSI
jgi:hypothetical protein